jgi:LysR family transcriptional regulator, nitrogen assimilation regulatory protein
MRSEFRALDVTQLKTLIHVAELGSLSKAADRLRIAQPALSRQIRLLEQELGASLFDRHGRGMVLTEIGREVLDHAARVMSELDAIRNTVAEGRDSYRGKVNIGTTPTVARIVTLPLVQKIREAHPQLAVRFSSAFSGFLIDWIQRGELETAVTYDPKPLKSLRIVPVMMENLLLVAGRDSGLSLSRAVPFSHIADAELILPSRPHGLRAIVEDCAQRVGIRPVTKIEVDSFEAMIDLVRCGFGATVLPLAPIYSLVNEGTLRAAPLVDPTPARKLVVLYSADRPVSQAARFVGEAFAEIAGDLVRRNVWAGHMLDKAQG